jgi:cytochrome o ubiquinol oxidase subunit 2
MSDIPAWQNGVLDPHGPIAAAERTILLNATVIMAAVIVPVMLMVIGFAWWYRKGNKAAHRRPDWHYSGPVEVTVWAIPVLVIIFLAGITWISSHDLEPAKPLPAHGPTRYVQVVSLDWKWLFIYPDLGIASVNRLVVPSGTPLHLALTSDSVMNSFFVPALGSQIYTMAGMVTTLNLQADDAGTYRGRSFNFSGDGFSDMAFDTVVVSPAQFDAWAAEAQHQGTVLDLAGYVALAKPGIAESPLVFHDVPQTLFDTIVMRTGQTNRDSMPGMAHEN